MSEIPTFPGLFVTRRFRLQNANAISAPMTWGFPSMTAFLGLMWALERKLAGKYPILFTSVGVICHHFEPQVSSEGFTRTFHLKRHPVTKTGDSSPFLEEGRVHLELTLVFGVDGKVLNEPLESRERVALDLMNTLSFMRVAGGSILELSQNTRHRPQLLKLEDDSEKRANQFRQLRRGWLPGFTLVLRGDLLQLRLSEISSLAEKATELDAWLDLARLNLYADRNKNNHDTCDSTMRVEWKPSPKNGWIVPIPVGYGAISDLMPPNAVANARDQTTAFRFVESVYSVGEWIAPHRLRDVREFLWYGAGEPEAGLYHCQNDYSSLRKTNQD